MKESCGSKTQNQSVNEDITHPTPWGWRIPWPCGGHHSPNTMKLKDPLAMWKTSLTHHHEIEGSLGHVEDITHPPPWGWRIPWPCGRPDSRWSPRRCSYPLPLVGWRTAPAPAPARAADCPSVRPDQQEEVRLGQHQLSPLLVPLSVLLSAMVNRKRLG